MEHNDDWNAELGAQTIGQTPLNSFQKTKTIWVYADANGNAGLASGTTSGHQKVNPQDGASVS